MNFIKGSLFLFFLYLLQLSWWEKPFPWINLPMESKERNLLVLKYGSYTFAIFLLLSMLLPLIGASLSLSQNILFVILGAEIFFCCKEYKERKNEDLSFNSAFTIGMKVSFIAGFLNAILVLLIIIALGETAITEAIYKSKRAIYRGWDDKLFDQIVGLITNPYFMAIITLVIYLIIGLLVSTLIALFVKGPNSYYKNEK